MKNLIDLKSLTKPVEMLIEKISNVVGVLYEPKRIEREAEAQAKADVIKAKSENEITALRQRSEHRRMMEEMRHQKNMESITAKALPQLNDNADASQMDDDWLANFFAKCRIVSNDEMQTLWSRILAGEANTPGAYSKRTVNCLSEMDKDEAEFFKKLCGFCWRCKITKDFLPTNSFAISNQVYQEVVNDPDLVSPLIFDSSDAIYNKHGIRFEILEHFDSIGLIKFFMSVDDNFIWTFNEDIGILGIYQDKTFFLSPSSIEKAQRTVRLGVVSFTAVGEELATLCETEPVDGFYDYVKTQWKEYSPLDIAIES